jgi:ABC-type transport system involved in multi-copper enzyme maturation permease subunit
LRREDIAAKEAKENLHGARVSMWAVLCAIVLALASSGLLLTGREVSPLDQREILCIVTSLAVGLGLLVIGLLAADPVVGEQRRATLEGIPPAPTKRGALLLGKVLGVMPAWLLIFAVSAPFVLVVGFGTGVSWVALTYAFVLGTLCVAGFAALTAGLGALSRSGRGVVPVFLAVFVATTIPALLGTTLRKSWFGDTYNVLSPFAQARLSLESVIVDKESLLVQLPHIGTLAAFAVIAGAFATFATAEARWKGSEWREGRGDRKPRGPHDTTVPAERTGSRLAALDPEKP